MLDDDAIARYARQIVIPAVGGAGQEKLLTATVLVVGDVRGCEQAALYLRAAGLTVIHASDDHAFEAVIVANTDALDRDLRDRFIASGVPICWYTLRSDDFVSGVHPDAPLPVASQSPVAAHANSALHDAAACDSASVACAILIGMSCSKEAQTFAHRCAAMPERE